MPENCGGRTELYTLFDLLAEENINAEDDDLLKNANLYFNVLNFIRKGVKDILTECHREKLDVAIYAGGTLMNTISAEKFLENAEIFLRTINASSGRSFNAKKPTFDFMRLAQIKSVKARDVSLKQSAFGEMFGGKNDIFIEVRDSQTAIVSVMGFSVKSKFASNPTLFNASSTSQFLYKVENCSDKKMREFNAIFDEGGHRAWKLCKDFLAKNNMKLNYEKVRNSVYAENLLLLRENMAKIMAWCAKDRLIFSKEKFEVQETSERMSCENPLGVSNPGVYYEKALKDFLMATFAGMTASAAWDGREQVNGGYIVVMEDGEVLCYHSNDREAFRDYLFRNTHFEYIDTKKFKWSFIEKSGGDYYLSLNVSVRFNKKTR